MKIVKRCEFDPAESIFVIIDCPNESIECEDGFDMKYFGKNGFMGDEEKNFSAD